jgi:hypothetical protein
VSKKQRAKKTDNDPIANRLDALIRLFIEMNKPKSQEKFTEATAARTLKSSGLTPTEIAKILGKKSATDVAPYLYPKKNVRTEVKKKEGEHEEVKPEETALKETGETNEPNK